jgi:hypothetical protein
MGSTPDDLDMQIVYDVSHNIAKEALPTHAQTQSRTYTHTQSQCHTHSYIHAHTHTLARTHTRTHPPTHTAQRARHAAARPVLLACSTMEHPGSTLDSRWVPLEYPSSTP